MSDFADAAALMDDALQSWDGIAATLLPQSGGSVAITGVLKPPAIEENYLPGSASGVNIVRLLVRFVDITPNPRTGDKVTINSVNYDVADVEVEVASGASVLKLKRNA